jgi:hypothetical protein
MTIAYKVHRVSAGSARVPVTLTDGSAVDADVRTLEVELTPVAGEHSAVTLRFWGNDAADAEATYKADGIVNADFAPAA